MGYSRPGCDLQLHVEYKYTVVQINTQYNVLMNQMFVNSVSDFILLEFNSFGNVTLYILMLLLCLYYLIRLSTNFQVAF